MGTTKGVAWKAVTPRALGDGFDGHINSVIGGLQWDANSINFSFPAAASNYTNTAGYSDSGETTAFVACSTSQKTIIRRAAAARTAVCNMSINEINESDSVHAQLRYGNTTLTSYGEFTQNISVAGSGGDSWFGNAVNQNCPLGGENWSNQSHEQGHGVGFKHPFSGSPTMPTAYDFIGTSEMTYRTYINGGTNHNSAETYGFMWGWSWADMEALQYQHGVNTAGITDETWSLNPTTGELTRAGVAQGAPHDNRIYFMPHWGGTCDVSSYSGVSLDFRPIQWSTVSSSQLPIIGPSSTHPPGNFVQPFNELFCTKNAILGGGSNTVVGNNLTNTITVSGTFSSYSISGISTGSATLTGSEGTHTLSNIDFIHFADGTRSCNSGGLAATRYCMIGIW